MCCFSIGFGGVLSSYTIHICAIDIDVPESIGFVCDYVSACDRPGNRLGNFSS